MMRVLAAIVSAFFLFTGSASACSYSVLTKFTEVGRSFTVAIRFENKPLAGATVEIFAHDTAQQRYSATTGRDGTARVSNLRPGKYNLETRHLGIQAGFDQIEVRARQSSQAKARMQYLWGQQPTLVRQIAGTIRDGQPGPGATPFLRLIAKPVFVPLGGAQLEVHHPTSGNVYTDTSNDQGEFAVTVVPEGTYVLQVRGGTNPNYEPANFLVKVTPAAKAESLQLTRGEICGSSVLHLQ